MKKFLILILTVLIIFSSYSQSFATHYDNAKDLVNLTEDYIKNLDSINGGAAISIFDDSDFSYEKYIGLSDIEDEIAFDEDTVVEWGSVSKILIWISAMKLAEEEKLDLNENINNYLDEDFIKRLNLKYPITMKNLMNHDAGFEELYFNLLLPKDSPQISLKDALLKNIPDQIFKPGDATIYSNYGTALAAYIIESISGEPYYEYVRKNIFDVLDMKSSAIAPILSDNLDVKLGRERLKSYTKEGKLITDDFTYMPLYPAGTLSSNLKDLIKFGKAILSRDERILKRETWQKFFTPTAYYGNSQIESNCHGLWVLPYEIKILGHHGTTKGNSSKLLLDLERNIGFAVLTNVRNEEVFNSKLPKILFGDYKNSDEFKPTKDTPNGFYKMGQKFQNGPLKLSGMKYIKAKDLGDEFFIYSNTPFEKISTPHADYIKADSAKVIFEMIIMICWMFIFLTSLIFIIFSIISKINKKFNKKDNLTLLSFFIIAVITSIVILSAKRMINYDFRANIFKLSFVLIAIFTIILAILFIKNLISLINSKENRKSKIIIFISQFIVLLNIIYWKLFMFWKV